MDSFHNIHTAVCLCETGYFTVNIQCFGSPNQAQGSSGAFEGLPAGSHSEMVSTPQWTQHVLNVLRSLSSVHLT